LTYNIVSAITLAPVAWLMWKMPDRALYSIPAPWSMFMWGVQTVAAILLALTLLQTNPLQFAGLSQILGRAEGSGLVSTGFYGIVRHPLYLLGLIFLWFAPHMSINQLAVSLALTAYLFIGALFEERRLEQEFGESYRQYRERTPMMFPAFSKRRSR
jgi:protein-S-isoprenylcysteine O-methyltransferase Ste14